MRVANVEAKLAQTVDDIATIRESIANLNIMSCNITDRRAQLDVQAQLREWHSKIMRLEYNVFILRDLTKKSDKG